MSQSVSEMSPTGFGVNLTDFGVLWAILTCFEVCLIEAEVSLVGTKVLLESSRHWNKSLAFESHRH